MPLNYQTINAETAEKALSAEVFARLFESTLMTQQSLQNVDIILGASI
jgi:hypothetical protein